MKAVKVLVLGLALALTLAACGGKKAKTKVSIEEAKGPERCQELFRDGVDNIRKGNYEQGRLQLNTMMNTYTDCPLIQMAKLAIADSFYFQGGSKNLAQAEVEYRDWIQFFPNHALADDAMMKIAEIHLKQVQPADRTTTHAEQAERLLKELLRKYPDTDAKEQVEGLMNQVQEILGMHELKIGRFYRIREAWPAVQHRTEEILNKYPNFSLFDEALFQHARAMENQEDTETASRDLARLVSSYPRSEFTDQAREKLKKWGKPVPEADPANVDAAGPERKGIAGRLVGFMMGPKIETSPKGVLIDRDLKTDQILKRAQEVSGTKIAGPVTPGADTTSNSPNARPRRATGAGQDVEVKPGSPTDQKTQTPSSSKDKKGKDEKKNDNSTKGLRNPPN